MIKERLAALSEKLPKHVDVVAVSKTKPNEDILEAYEAGQRIFGENKVQEVSAKAEELPNDIEWHFIGHLQTNKVKYIAPFISLIHSLDSLKLAKEINKRGAQNNRKIDCLVQVHVAEEESKFGLKEAEVIDFLNSEALKAYEHVRVVGIMGMATNTANAQQIRAEFIKLKSLFTRIEAEANALLNEPKAFKHLSMGMSGDYEIAVETGSTMVRVGSSIFGARNYN